MGARQDGSRRTGHLRTLLAALPLTLVAASPVPTSPTAAPAPGPRSPGTVREAVPPPLPAPPVSVPRRASTTRFVTAAAGVEAARTSASYGIPRPAMEAYQRAAQVMAATDGACRLPWQLLAAIGHVESGHGSVGGSSLDRHGRAQPAIVGPRLDGTGRTAAIRDSDGGRLDGDRRWDRAVGPMQFIPTTWGAVAVDADGDGARDPQDIHDAALAAAVHLCAGDADLSTRPGASEALLRYNHSRPYVLLVLSLADAYAEARVLDVTAVPLPVVLRDDPPTITVTAARTRPAAGDAAAREHDAGRPVREPSIEPSATPEPEPAPDPAPEEPVDEEPAAEEPEGEEPAGGCAPAGEPGTEPTDPATDPVTDDGAVEDGAVEDGAVEDGAVEDGGVAAGEEPAAPEVPDPDDSPDGCPDPEPVADAPTPPTVTSEDEPDASG